MYTKDGRILWLRDQATLSREGGRPHWRGVMSDITPQKEAEEKLRWSLEVLRRTIQERRDLAVRLETAEEEERAPHRRRYPRRSHPGDERDRPPPRDARRAGCHDRSRCAG